MELNTYTLAVINRPELKIKEYEMVGSEPPALGDEIRLHIPGMPGYHLRAVVVNVLDDVINVHMLSNRDSAGSQPTNTSH